MCYIITYHQMSESRATEETADAKVSKHDRGSRSFLKKFREYVHEAQTDDGQSVSPNIDL